MEVSILLCFEVVVGRQVLLAASVDVSIGLSVSGVEPSAMHRGDVILHGIKGSCREAENMA